MKNKQHGFSLVELLVVIGVIAILATISIITFGYARDSARTGKAVHFADSIHRVLGADAVGIWKFDQVVGGITPDASGWGNDATVFGATLVPGMEMLLNSQALQFDAANEYVSIPHSQILSSQVFGTATVFTLSAWAYPTAWINYSTIMNKATAGSWSNTTAGLWSYISGFRCIMGSNVDGNPAGSSIGPTYQPALNNWHHIVCTADGTYLKMYVDGTLRGQSTISTLTYPRSENTAPLVFGRRSAGTAESFPGMMDNIAVYGEALTLGQVRQLYAQGLKDHSYIIAKNEAK